MWLGLSIFSQLSITKCGAVCFQFIHFPCDDWENIYASSNYHLQIGSMNYYPLLRARLWNNGMRCMSLYVLKHLGLACFESYSQTYRLRRSNTASTWETCIQIWTTCLFLDANTTSLPDAVSCQHGMLPMIGNLRCCKNIHWGNKGLCHSSMDVCWPHDIVPDKIKSHLNYHCQLTFNDWGIPKHKAEVLPVCIRCTTLLPKQSDILLCITDMYIWFMHLNSPTYSTL